MLPSRAAQENITAKREKNSIQADGHLCYYCKTSKKIAN